MTFEFKVESVNISEKKGVQKRPVEEIELVQNYGIKGDAHAGKWHRQVSFLGGESIDSMRAKAGDFEIKHGDFAENITTEGIDLLQIPVGRRMRVGGALVEVTCHGKECPAPCAIYRQAGYCVMPTEGIFVRVIESGEIKPEDIINFVEK